MESRKKKKIFFPLSYVVAAKAIRKISSTHPRTPLSFAIYNRMDLSYIVIGYTKTLFRPPASLAAVIRASIGLVIVIPAAFGRCFYTVRQVCAA